MGLKAHLQAAARQISEPGCGDERDGWVERSGVMSVLRSGLSLVIASGAGGLGLSYEVTDVQFTSSKAQVWTLEKVTFTGAAILRRDKAAYTQTWIELESQYPVLSSTGYLIPSNHREHRGQSEKVWST